MQRNRTSKKVADVAVPTSAFDRKLEPSMKMLKKIVMYYVNMKVKRLVAAVLKFGVWLAYDGIDAVNMHFSGDTIHNHFIHLCVLKNSEADVIAKPSEAINDILRVLVADLNDLVVELTNNESCKEIRKIVNHCSTTTINQERYFSKEGSSAYFNYTDRKGKGKKFEFVRVDDLTKLDTEAMENFGMKYTHLKHADVKILQRKNLTFCYPAMERLLRVCFPAIAHMKCKSQSVVSKSITKLVASNQSAQDYHETLLQELQLEIANQTQSELITLDELLRRAVCFGYIPDNDKVIKRLNNDYNITILRELKTEMFGYGAPNN